MHGIFNTLSSLILRLSKLGGAKAKREPGEDCTRMPSHPHTHQKRCVHLPTFIIVHLCILIIMAGAETAVSYALKSEEVRQGQKVTN